VPSDCSWASRYRPAAGCRGRHSFYDHRIVRQLTDVLSCRTCSARMEPLVRQLNGDRPVYCSHFVGFDASGPPPRSIEIAGAPFPQIRRVSFLRSGACRRARTRERASRGAERATAVAYTMLFDAP